MEAYFKQTTCVALRATNRLYGGRRTLPALHSFFLYIGLGWMLIFVVNSYQFLNHVEGARLMPLEPVGHSNSRGAFVALRDTPKNPFEDEEENTEGSTSTREGLRDRLYPVLPDPNGEDMAKRSTPAYAPPLEGQTSVANDLAKRRPIPVEEDVAGQRLPRAESHLEASPSANPPQKNSKCAFQATVLVDGFHEKSLGTLSVTPEAILASRRQLSESIALFREYYPASKFSLLHATPDETDCLRVVSGMDNKPLPKLPLPAVSQLGALPEKEEIREEELKLRQLRSQDLVAPEGAESSSMAQNPMRLMENTLAYILQEPNTENLQKVLVLISDSAPLPQNRRFTPKVIIPGREVEQLQTLCSLPPLPTIEALDRLMEKAENPKPVILFLVDNRVLEEYKAFAKALGFIKSTVRGFDSITEIPQLFAKGVKDLRICSRSSALRTAGKVAGGVAALGALAGLGYGISELARYMTRPSTVPPLRPPRFPGLPIPVQGKVTADQHQQLPAHPMSGGAGEAFFRDVITLTLLTGLTVAASGVWADY